MKKIIALITVLFLVASMSVAQDQNTQVEAWKTDARTLNAPALANNSYAFHFFLKFINTRYPTPGGENLPVAASMLTRAFYNCNSAVMTTAYDNALDFVTTNETPLNKTLALFDLFFDLHVTQYTNAGGTNMPVVASILTWSLTGTDCDLYAFPYPVAAADSFVLQFDNGDNDPVTLNIISNDDLNGLTFNYYEFTTMPDSGSLDTTGQVVTYERTDDAFEGVDTFAYVLHAGGQATDTVTVLLEMSNESVLPVAVNDTIGIEYINGENDTTLIAILSNDDLNGLTFDSIHIVDAPNWGTVFRSGQVVRYLRTDTFNAGGDTLKYILHAGGQLSDTATVFINFTNTEANADAFDFDVEVPYVPFGYSYENFDFADHVDLTPVTGTIVSVIIDDFPNRGQLTQVSGTIWKVTLSAAEIANIGDARTITFDWHIVSSDGATSGVATSTIVIDN